MILASRLPALIFSQTSSNIFYFDASPPGGATPLVCSYFSYDLTNNSGADINDVWVRISLSAGCIALAPAESGDFHAGFMANGQVKHLFFYLHNSCASQTSAPQSYTLTAYSGVPAASPIDSAAFSFVKTEATQQTNTNTVNIVFSGPNPPSIGGQIAMTVSGTVNTTIGSAKILSFSPASYLDWPAQNFIMIGSTISLFGSNTGTYDNQLLLPTSAITDTSGVNYNAVYYFRAGGSTPQAVTVSPIAFISSGTQVKHTDTGGYSGAAFQPISSSAANYLSLSKTVAPGSTSVPFGLVYRLRLTNSGTVDSTLDQFVDTPALIPGAPSFVPGSSSYNGSPIPDPSAAGGMLTWSGTFLVPAGTFRDLLYQMELSCSPGTFTNTAIALVGSTQIDTTLDATDNSPAASAVNLLVCTPSNTPTFTASPTRTASPTPTMTATPSKSPTPPGTLSFTPTFSASPSRSPSFTETVSSTGTPTSSMTGTDSPTSTPSSTPTATETGTSSVTWTATPTATPSATHTPSATETATPTSTPTSSPTISPTYSASPSNTPGDTETFTHSPTSTGTPTWTPSATGTASGTASPTSSLTSSTTSTPSATPSDSPTPTATESFSPTVTVTSSRTETATDTPSATGTATPTASQTFTASPPSTATPSPSITETGTTTATPTVTETATETATPSATPSPTGTRSATETATETATPSETPSVTPSVTGSASPSPTMTVSATASPSPAFTPLGSLATPTAGPGRLLRLHPNPVRQGGLAYVNFGPQGQDTDWSVFNLAGERVASLSFRGVSRQFWSSQGMASGLYLIVIAVHHPGGEIQFIRLKSAVIQ